MPRSPFQGTFRPNARPTVVTAPDALVYINGEAEVIGCPSCRRRFDLNKYITSITVDLSVDSVPGSASFTLSVPRHSIDDIMVEGKPVITEMMEVEIFMKGYYLVEGLPQYYPTFWGLITEVGESYSSGEHTISVQCADILKWWELCKMNINPAYTAPKGQTGTSLFGNTFFGKNPFDIIWQLALHSFGDVLVGTGSMVSMYQEAGQGKTFDAAMHDMMLYWEERFSRMRSNLLMYGTNGVTVRGASLSEAMRTKSGKMTNMVSRAVATANGGPDALQMVFDPTGPEVVAFRTQGSQAGQINLWQSEYQTKLELANAAKEAAGYEFFMDVTGDIVFKPPFYNLDIMANKPVSWIQDIDVIEWDFSSSEAEVVTQLILQGNYTENIDWGLPEECTPYTSVTDYHLLRQYGWRSENYNSEFMADPSAMFYHGMDILDRKNSRRHRGTVGIPLRPELRLGFPIYVAPKDQIWYISGISHNISFGGRAQTTLTLTSRRGKFIAPKGIGTLQMDRFSSPRDKHGKPRDIKLYDKKQWGFRYSSRDLAHGAHFTLKVGECAELPPTQESLDKTPGPYEPLILRHPKTGRVMGYPNVVMVYTRPFAPTDAELRKAMGQRKNQNQFLAKKNQKKNSADAQALLNDMSIKLSMNREDSIKERYHVNRYSYGLNSAGVYIYAYDASDADKFDKIREFALVPSTNVDVQGLTEEQKKLKKTLFAQSAMIRPVSDERGFEVIGHFRYGRGVSLRDGSLVRSTHENDEKGNVKPANNLRANVDMQMALGGDLFATLDAQSQGLTTALSAYANPVDAVTRMQPDDLQTAAIINPDTNAPEYVTAKDTFVDSAPLGSPEQRGLPVSAEAGQLSRALTLAEMTVAEDVILKDFKCGCLMGRADLAWINVGYQFKVLGPAGANTVPDSSTLYDSKAVADQFNYNSSHFAAASDTTTAAQKTLDDLQKQLDAATKDTEEARNRLISVSDADDDVLGLTDAATKKHAQMEADADKALYKALVAKRSKIEEDLRKQITEANAALTQSQSSDKLTPRVTAGEDTLPRPARSDFVALSPQEAMTRVDQYLFGLYKTLDDTHQQYEATLRGATSADKAGVDGTTAGLPQQQSELAPPFSAPNRYAAGDPLAIGLQASQATDGIKKAWSDFSTNLQKDSKKTQLQGEASKLQSDIQVLERQKQALLDAQTPGSIRLGLGNTSDALAAVEKELSDKQQQLAKRQQELAQMA